MTDSIQGTSPKSPRYCYTDPLAVAWMAKHFGMKFLVRCFRGFRPILRSEYLTGSHSLIKTTTYYISDESLHLLEPQIGDVVFDDGRPSWCSVRVVHDDRIVMQRNGLAFHWPESEAA